MPLIVVNVFTDNNEHTDTLLVSKDNDVSKTTFEIAWKKTLEEVKQTHPEDWNIDQVYKKLRDNGWNIIFLRDAIEISY